MEDMIRRIISIEGKAQSVMTDAKNAENALSERIESEERRIRREVLGKASAKSLKLKELEEEEVRKKIDDINSKTKEQLIGLEEKYSENKEKWVDDMVGHIIGD